MATTNEMNVATHRAYQYADLLIAKINRSTTPKGRALVLRSVLENFRPGLSGQVSRMIMIGGGSPKAMRDALARTIMDAAARYADPSLGDIDDLLDRAATTGSTVTTTTTSTSSSSSGGFWDRFRSGVNAVGGMLTGAVDIFERVYDSVTEAREAAAQAEHERALAVFAAETSAANEAAAAALEALQAAAPSSSASTYTAPPAGTPSWIYIVGGVIAVGALGGVIYAVTR